MNILITLPKNLLDKIICGEKTFEMRKCKPKLMKVGEDGFFVVEKGTDVVRCWCRVDDIIETYMDHNIARHYSTRLCVAAEDIQKYAKADKVFLWKIGRVYSFKCVSRNTLSVDKNPQQFVYCRWSYGVLF